MNNDKKFVLVVFVAKSIKKIFKVNRKKKKTKQFILQLHT